MIELEGGEIRGARFKSKQVIAIASARVLHYLQHSGSLLATHYSKKHVYTNRITHTVIESFVGPHNYVSLRYAGSAATGAEKHRALHTYLRYMSQKSRAPTHSSEISRHSFPSSRKAHAGTGMRTPQLKGSKARIHTHGVSCETTRAIWSLRSGEDRQLLRLRARRYPHNVVQLRNLRRSSCAT